MAADLDERFRPPVEYRPAVRDLCLRIVEVIRPVARAHGYALTLHGSLERDLDVLLVPWIEDVSSAKTVVKAVQKAITDEITTCWRDSRVGDKPHGRRVWTLLLKDGVKTPNGEFPFIDLGVMPKRRKRKTGQ